MKILRRILIIPVVLAMIGIGLVLAGTISVETDLPLDTIIWVMGAVLGGLLLWEVVALARSWQLPEPEEPPTYEGVITPRDVKHDPEPMDVEQRAVQKVEEAEDYSRQATERVRIRIDMDMDDDDQDE